MTRGGYVAAASVRKSVHDYGATMNCRRLKTLFHRCALALSTFAMCLATASCISASDTQPPGLKRQWAVVIEPVEMPTGMTDVAITNAIADVLKTKGLQVI